MCVCVGGGGGGGGGVEMHCVEYSQTSRTMKKSIKIKIILNKALILYNNSSNSCKLCVLSVSNVFDTILPNSWVDT